MTFNDRIEYMKKAYEFGAEGYKAGKKRGGAYNKDFLDFVKSIDEETVFSRFSQRLFDEYNKGWDEANLGNWDAEKGEEIYSVDSGKKVAVEEYDDDFTFKKTYGADIEYCPVCKGDLQVDEDGNLYCPECGNVEKTARKKVYHEDKEDYVLSFERDDKDYEVDGNNLTGYVTYTFGEHIPGAIEVDFTCRLDEVDAKYEKSGGDIVPYWGSTATLPEYDELVDVDAKGATTANFKYFVGDKAVNEQEFVEKAVITNDELAKIKDKLLNDTNEYIADTIFDSPEMLGENLKEGIISGANKKLSYDELAKLEKELYEYLRKEWQLYPSDGTFDNARDGFSDLELTLYVDGDWKHDHLATQEAVKEFCDKANLAIINHEQVEIGESDSDSYEAKHTWKLAFDEDDKRVSNKIAGFKKMFEDTETINEDGRDYRTAQEIKDSSKPKPSDIKLKSNWENDTSELFNQLNDLHNDYIEVVTNDRTRFDEPTKSAQKKINLIKSKVVSLLNGNGYDDKIVDSIMDSFSIINWEKNLDHALHRKYIEITSIDDAIKRIPMMDGLVSIALSDDDRRFDNYIGDITSGITLEYATLIGLILMCYTNMGGRSDRTDKIAEKLVKLHPGSTTKDVQDARDRLYANKNVRNALNKVYNNYTAAD